ncbi:hypothetical protein [Bdellovibrio sp. HCB-162]|uniref:hypothetical protein n=1 Tax=Bdellovibrio sp. HCB-162 TaxID=3394234 RepID=UPI0039BCFD03
MEKKNVQVQMMDQTLNKIEELREVFHTSSRSDVVKLSVDVAEVIAKALAEKSSVIIKDKNGNETKIVIPGVG